jgi:hypothetical protein
MRDFSGAKRRSNGSSARPKVRRRVRSKEGSVERGYLAAYKATAFYWTYDEGGHGFARRVAKGVY